MELFFRSKTEECQLDRLQIGVIPYKSSQCKDINFLMKKQIIESNFNAFSEIFWKKSENRTLDVQGVNPM